ncbi:MAG: sugar phosphate isomerase/epimerase family protein [Bacteroidota bacterium]
MTDRRTFLGQSLLAGTGIVAGLPLLAHAMPKNPAYYLSLKGGNIGVSLSPFELLEAAETHGFEAISIEADQLLDLSEKDRKKFRKKKEKLGLKWGASGLPLDFRKDKDTFEKGIAALPEKAEILNEFGITRMGTWIMPTHPSLSYVPNLLQHTERLRKVAQTLQLYNIRFGLEYVAPKTLMSRSRFPFIRTMQECLQLIHGINVPNVGLILDSFHWYCAEDTIDELLQLNPEQIVAVDLNDATAGRTRDEQVDGQRQLPMASGIIDLKAFMEALAQIGYDGPLRAEPFNQELRDMKPAKALETTANSMKTTIALAG